MFEMGSHDSFEHFKHQLWPKERSGGKLIVQHTIEKLLKKAITLLQTSSQSEIFTQSYGPPKSRESQLCEFRDSHLGILGQNDIWVFAMHIVYYRGEGGGFPQVRAVVSLVSPCLPVVSPCTKVLQLCTK
jgi:hypothetical protein